VGHPPDARLRNRIRTLVPRRLGCTTRD